VGEPVSDPWEHIDLSARKPHLSTKLAADVLRYLDQHYPQIDTERLCRDAGLSIAYIQAEDQWLSITAFQRLHALAEKMSGDKTLARKVGEFAFQNTKGGPLFQFFAKNTLSVSMIYRLLPHFTALFNQVVQMNVTKLEPGRVDLTLRPDYSRQTLDDEEKNLLNDFFDQIVQSIFGYYTSIPLIHGLPQAEGKIEVEVDASGQAHHVQIEYAVVDRLHLMPYVAASVGFLGIGTVMHLYSFEFALFIPAVGLISVLIAFLRKGAFLKGRALNHYTHTVNVLSEFEDRYASLHHSHLRIHDIVDSYKRFVPFPYLDFLGVSDIVDVDLQQSAEKPATVMSCDIRGFTRLSEALPPKETLDLLNDHFGDIVPIIEENGGFVDKFIGDEFVAIFPPDGHRAVHAATQVLQKTHESNLRRAQNAKPEIQIGIGVATGSILIGTVGSETLIQVTAISDTVDIASHLQDLTKSFQTSLLICNKTLRVANLKSEVPNRRIIKLAEPSDGKAVHVFEVFTDPASRHKYAPSEMTDLAIATFERGNLEQARQLFEEIAQANPTDSLPRYYLADIINQSEKEAHGRQMGTY